MKNLTLILFTLFLAYSVKGQDNLDQVRMIFESHEVVKESRQLREQISQNVPTRSLASLGMEDAKWLEEWNSILNDTNEDELYWLNKIQ